jgi:hypothetical protein
MSDQQASGAINEKVRHLSANSASNDHNASTGKSFSRSHRSHLWHALEGLDRYPNYLNRWSERDMSELELALEEQLAKVRQQRHEVNQRRATITKHVKQHFAPDALRKPESWDQIKDIIHPALCKAIFSSRQFQTRPLPSLASVVSGEIQIHLDAHLLEELMDQEVYDVYSLPLFQPDFCNILRNYIQTLLSGDVALHMTTSPIDLDMIGLGWINDLLFHVIVRPISLHLYKETECLGGDLDWRQGYIAYYAAESDVRNRLVAHTDDSEVTLNIGLGADFDGGRLEFRGLRGDGAADLLGDYQPVQGRAVMHAGRHFHTVTQVTRGDRFALILWARSWGSTRAKTCPCCWLTRRQGSNCICGPRWN